MKPYLYAVLPLVVAACSHQPREFDVSGQPAPQAAPGVSFAGTWTYNPEDSDQPGRYGMGGGGVMVGGRGGYGGEGGDRGGVDSLMRRPAGRLVITQTDSSLTISPREGTAYTLFFDGRDVVLDDSTGRTWQLSGRWHGKRFDVRRVLPNGMLLTEGYEIKKNGRRLVIHLQLQREEREPAMPEFQRVYDRYGQ